jgi:hypothetical protein
MAFDERREREVAGLAVAACDVFEQLAVRNTPDRPEVKQGAKRPAY